VALTPAVEDGAKIVERGENGDKTAEAVSQA
jgi:hypothetical protein